MQRSAEATRERYREVHEVVPLKLWQETPATVRRLQGGGHTCVSDVGDSTCGREDISARRRSLKPARAANTTSSW